MTQADIQTVKTSHGKEVKGIVYYDLLEKETFYSHNLI